MLLRKTQTILWNKSPIPNSKGRAMRAEFLRTGSSETKPRSRAREAYSNGFDPWRQVNRLPIAITGKSLPSNRLLAFPPPKALKGQVLARAALQESVLTSRSSIQVGIRSSSQDYQCRWGRTSIIWQGKCVCQRIQFSTYKCLWRCLENISSFEG